MSRTIKLSIKARGEIDSPTVEDLLDQVRDYFEILKGVEQAVAEDGENAIDWRIVAATTNSPITFEAQAFARDYGVNVDNRAEIVARQTALGLFQLETTDERPSYFTDKVLARAEKLFERVTNGLERTFITFGDDLPTIDITPAIARRATDNVRTALRPESKPYDELGSAEGFVDRIEKDAWGRPIVRLRLRLTGETVKCFVKGNALKALENRQIGDVWRGRRVQLFGKLKFKALGVLNQIEADEVRFLRTRDELPSIDDIQDENFTGGLSTEEYLIRIRDGRPS
jgi:hypothetical protein